MSTNLSCNRPDPRLDYGLIAEEVIDVYPDLVVTDLNNFPTVQYHKLYGIMIAELQRLQRENQAVLAEIECLKQQIEALK